METGSGEDALLLEPFKIGHLDGLKLKNHSKPRDSDESEKKILKAEEQERNGG